MIGTVEPEPRRLRSVPNEAVGRHVAAPAGVARTRAEIVAVLTALEETAIRYVKAGKRLPIEQALARLGEVPGGARRARAPGRQQHRPRPCGETNTVARGGREC
jgi:hypothetical protein